MAGKIQGKANAGMEKKDRKQEQSGTRQDIIQKTSRDK